MTSRQIVAGAVGGIVLFVMGFLLYGARVHGLLRGERRGTRAATA